MTDKEREWAKGFFYGIMLTLWLLILNYFMFRSY